MAVSFDTGGMYHDASRCVSRQRREVCNRGPASPPPRRWSPTSPTHTGGPVLPHLTPHSLLYRHICRLSFLRFSYTANASAISTGGNAHVVCSGVSSGAGPVGVEAAEWCARVLSTGWGRCNRWLPRRGKFLKFVPDIYHRRAPYKFPLHKVLMYEVTGNGMPNAHLTTSSLK